MKKHQLHEIGLGLRPPHYERFVGGRPLSVNWVEVISENFMDWRHEKTPAARLKLAKIRENVPVSLHGVSMSLGSSESVDRKYLQSLKDLISFIEPESVSDHLCWTGLRGKNAHDLLPLPYTQEAVNLVADKILEVQDFLGRPIAIENLSSYVEFKSSEMPEWDFINQITRRSGCQLILDLNNIYVSSVNHKFRALSFLEAIDKTSVAHMHLAGHTKKEDHLVDTHDQPVSPEVWDLYRWACRNIPGPKVMLERDDNIPPWEEIEEELGCIKNIQRQSHGSA